jgi:hypothetical protein
VGSEGEQVLHQALHALRLLGHHPEIAPALGRGHGEGFVREGLDEPREHGHRGLQLVRHVGHEVPAHLVQAAGFGAVLEQEHAAAVGQRDGACDHLPGLGDHQPDDLYPMMQVPGRLAPQGLLVFVLCEMDLCPHEREVLPHRRYRQRLIQHLCGSRTMPVAQKKCR